ncbi:hypothetical protein EVAR_66963_1 [Eumeta japonica]|uniref:Uncharacterized protein n=1 Tax=Eumeta variegata TaxID=151549 RepID=A0A4C1ZWL3_EUMVA|nr:hypothetical protein EVAR_66963_1 [Eumeta japonica]
MVVKAEYGRRKIKVESMQWRCDRCVVCVECLGKIDVEIVMLRERCGVKEYIATRVERSMLRWFVYQERMNKSRLTKQNYKTNMYDEKVGKGCPRKSYADHIGGILKKAKFKSPETVDLA